MQIIHHELNKVDDWCERWSLELNTKKCGWLCIEGKSVRIKITLNKNTTQTHISKWHRCTLHRLIFSKHIPTKLSKMQKFLGSILCDFFQYELEIILYNICVRPIVEYCPLLFSNLRQSDMMKMKVIQCDFTHHVLKISSVIDYLSSIY